jgi:glycosyltransferase involved in cell wall biosynthesis
VLLGRALGVPVISMVLDKQATRWTLRGADRLITTAPDLIPSEYHHKLVEVSWGANTEAFRPDIEATGLRHRLGFRDEEFVVGYTGAFYPWHGLETLVGAAQRLAGEPDAQGLRFLLVGDGTHRPAIEAQIDAAGLRPRFQSIGRVPYDEVPNYIAACDACVAPYDPSGNADLKAHGMFFDPLKVFEYLASGKPTITLDSDNIRRLFRHGEHALLVPPGDPAALAAAILQVIRMPDRGKSLGEAGRRLVASRFTWQAHADRLTTLFEDVVAERHGRR